MSHQRGPGWYIASNYCACSDCCGVSDVYRSEQYCPGANAHVISDRGRHSIGPDLYFSQRNSVEDFYVSAYGGATVDDYIHWVGES